MKEGMVEIQPAYFSKLGETLFPDSDFFSMRAQTYLSEALNEYGKGLNDLEDFISYLKEFTPMTVKTSIQRGNSFTKSTIAGWELEDRPLIINKLKAHFSKHVK